MKVIFLDFDGVMNTAETRGDDYLENPCSDRFIPVLNELIRKSEALIVVSSSWRHWWPLEKLKLYLRRRGVLGRVIDTTPSISVHGDARGFEIQDWLNTHPQVSHFVILDDDVDMVHLRDKLVWVNPDKGLGQEELEQALQHLT